ncbi:phosphoribosylpyrophosphate synthetase [Pelomyxa schiedti]|nr:phosphoribosylpyrophosphate synthetase [Pelomyxa schiedti]
MQAVRYTVRVLSGTSNAQLASSVATQLGVDLTNSIVGRFADGEIKMQVNESIRGSDMFVVQSTCPPCVDSAIQELILLIHTCKLSSAARVTAVVPYYGYGRQDRKRLPRVPISALCVANQILSAEPDRLIFVDLHNGQLQGFFGNTPTDHLSAFTVFAQKFTEMFGNQLSDVVICSPDAAGVSRAKLLADMLKIHSMATIIKRQMDHVTEGSPAAMRQLVGDVKNKIAILYDDIIDTGQTLVLATELLASAGARAVYAASTHGVFSANSLRLIEESHLTRVFITDTIPQADHLARCSKLECLSMAPIIAAAIETIHEELSVGALQTGAP